MVPHVVSVLPRLGVERRLDYLIDVALVELARISPEELETAVELVKTTDSAPWKSGCHFAGGCCWRRGSSPS